MQVSVPSRYQGTQSIAGGREDEEDRQDAFHIETIKIHVSGAKIQGIIISKCLSRDITRGCGKQRPGVRFEITVTRVYGDKLADHAVGAIISK